MIVNLKAEKQKKELAEILEKTHNLILYYCKIQEKKYNISYKHIK